MAVLKFTEKLAMKLSAVTIEVNLATTIYLYKSLKDQRKHSNNAPQAILSFATDLYYKYQLSPNRCKYCGAKLQLDSSSYAVRRNHSRCKSNSDLRQRKGEI
jgi:hypothetical protein